MRVLAVLLAVALGACTSGPITALSTPAPTREPGVVNVSVLLDLSGPRSPSGQPQRDAMRLWMNQSSGAAPALRVKFVDVAGSDATLLLELRRAMVDDRADAVVVGVPAPRSDSLLQAAQAGSVPVILTLPADEPTQGGGGRYVFALAPTLRSIAELLARELVAGSLLAPGLFAGDESPAAIAERASLQSELRGRGIEPPMPVSLATPLGAQRVRTAAAFAKSVVLFGASAAYVDVIRGIPVTPAAPRVYLSYLTETIDVTNLRDQAVLVAWPGSRSLLAPVAPTPFQRAFVRQFTDQQGPPSALAATAYDALALIASAAAAAPSELDAERLRLRLENSTFAGLVTTYTFTPARHAGFALPDLALLRWNAQRGLPVVQ